MIMCNRAVLFVGVVLAASASAWAAPDLALWGYFPIGEDDFTDHSGNGHHGTPVDGPATVFDAERGWVAAFNDQPSAMSRVLCGTDDPSDGGALSVAAWVYWEGINGYWQAIAGKSFGYEDRKWIFQLQDSDGAIQWGGTDRLNLHILSEDPLPDHEWLHLTGTCDGSLSRIYINGAVFSEGAGGFEPGLAEAANVTLGFGEDRSDYDESFNGLLDEIYIFSQALSQEEVMLVMRGLTPELASDPVPGENETDVPIGTILAWTPGQYAATHDVYLGTSFDDVNDAGRDNPLDMLASQSQDANAYDPPAPLDFGQTYYWRIDEVNAAPDETIFKGKIWSFSTEPFGYPVEGIIATSNGTSDEGQGPENTVNGSGLNARDEHSIDALEMWLSVPAAAESIWIEYEFDRVYKLHQMLVWNYNSQFEPILGIGFKDVAVEYSENGTDWIALGDFEFAQATSKTDYVANTTVAFGGIPVKHVRLTANGGYGTMGSYGLSEVRFLYIPVQAREPEPQAGATEVSVESALSWRGGREAVTHEVHLDADQQAVLDGTALLDTVDQSSYTPGGLEFATLYYWKVNEVNEAEAIASWEGTLWDFTTQAYAAIDDFESYDNEDNLIYDAWIDGWTNGTGSTVGYLQEPFAETEIVHGGKQSMPLEYDNGSTPYYSEATRDLGGVDLTAGGADSLRLYVQGSEDNASAMLYVALEDSAGNVAVATYADPDAALVAEWQEWTIPLETFSGAGVNLAAVQTIYVGLGDRDNPTAGGAGLIYIDDIQFGRPLSDD